MRFEGVSLPDFKAKPSGFTLLEVVVAVAILGVGVGVAMQIFAGGLKNIHKIELAHRAMNHAENVMNEILTDESIRGPMVVSEDLDEEFRYEAAVEYWQEPEERLSLDIVEMSVHLLQVRVDIHFKNDRHGKVYRSVSLKTISEQTPSMAPGGPTGALQQLFGGTR